MLRRVGTQFVRLWYTIAMQIIDCDYFVVGSGMSGLMSALHLAPAGRTVLVTKQRLEDCNTNFAQGGICCVADPADSFEEHVRDTQIAGAGLCDEAVVRKIVSEAPAGIRDLIDCGVRFAKKEDGKWDLGREGGHSMRRIFHAGDITGQKCEAAMVRTVKRHPEIEVHENTIVIDLIITKRIGVKGTNRCIGAYVLDRETEEIYAIRSPNTILATGGCGKVYLYTCNPDVATGDGVALAWRAGAKVENMEFIQFHPTCLYHPQAKRFLISEAVRGEGAVLVDRHGQPFMQKYDARGSLAPRDIVARAIDSEMKRTGDPYCCLDIRRKGRAFLEAHGRPLLLPRHPAQGPRLPREALSQHLPQVPRVWHRHVEGPHPDRARRALLLRRRAGDSGRTHLRAGALGSRRDGLHGTPRRKPPRVQLAP